VPKTAADLETRRFTADEVLRMVAAGVLAEDEPLELLEGRLVVVSPQGPSHAYVTGQVARVLRGAIEAKGVGYVREEKPLALGADSLPEPDVAAVSGAPADHAGRHPTGGEAIVVVEVAVTSQEADRAKRAIYARGGVEVLWLVDVVGRTVEVHTEPQRDGRYRRVEVLAEGDALSVPGGDAPVVVRDLLP